MLWISLFSRGLLHTLDQVKAFYHLQDCSKAEEHVDIRMDAAQLQVKSLVVSGSQFLYVVEKLLQKSDVFSFAILR